MDPPPTSFSGRRRSSVFNAGGPPPSPPSSASTAPRKASTWDSLPEPSTAVPTASDISSRRPTVTSDGSVGSASGYSDAGSVAGRKASAWDDPAVASGGARASVSDVAGRRATALDRPPWDMFSGAPPGYDGSAWGWMSDIRAMISGTSPLPLNEAGPTSDRNRIFYAENINYIFEIHENQSLAIGDIESIIYAYGLQKSNAEDILNKLDPKKIGTFTTNSQNKQILLDLTIKFSPPKEPLINLRHASKCFEKRLLSPLHFAGYIIEVLKGKYFENEPPFMILGIYSIFGVMEGSTKRKLTTTDFDNFTKMWKVLKPNVVQDLFFLIIDDHDNSISSWGLYNLLYRRNMFGEQRIQAFDTLNKPNSSMFFLILDEDEDGYLSSKDFCSFAAIFGKNLTNGTIDRVIRKLDMDGDGKISLEDFVTKMAPIFYGLRWEFWLVALLLTFEL